MHGCGKNDSAKERDQKPINKRAKFPLSKNPILG